jgi:hypothetical protein
VAFAVGSLCLTKEGLKRSSCGPLIAGSVQVLRRLDPEDDVIGLDAGRRATRAERRSADPAPGRSRVRRLYLFPPPKEEGQVRIEAWIRLGVPGRRKIAFQYLADMR